MCFHSGLNTNRANIDKYVGYWFQLAIFFFTKRLKLVCLYLLFLQKHVNVSEERKLWETKAWIALMPTSMLAKILCQPIYSVCLTCTV